jgi:D-sedoheptulose 7-phosphate isomerase
VVAEFFQREAAELARACHAMARAFARGGTLIPFGAGAAATDTAHAAVEFMHPVIVGKRALPAIAPSNDPTDASTLSALAGPNDIALAISHGKSDPLTARFLEAARARGLLAIELRAGETGGREFSFAVPSDDPAIVQETQETAYHVLWELVHVFFERPGLVDDACITCGDVAVEARVAEVRGSTAVIEKDGAREEVVTELVEDLRVGELLLCHAGVALEKLPKDSQSEGLEPESASAEPRLEPENGSAEPPDAKSVTDPTDFLYPFQGSGERADLDAVLRDVEASTLEKAGEVTALRSVIDTGQVARVAYTLRERLEAGGRLLAFGNGGSATDAQDLATDSLARGWSAVALNNDGATVTAVANDVGTEQVFARQLIALGRPGDVAVAISTSGGSPNVIAGVQEAHRRGLVTVALAGYDGGRLAALDALDHLFVVPSDHIPRIQEAQATIYHLLLEAIGDRATSSDPGREAEERAFK